jgi:pimeloyl-ACP methyl ester carboxylesterase
MSVKARALQAFRCLGPICLIPLLSAATAITPLDPVSELLNGPKVTTNLTTLATMGVPVVAASADGVTEVVLRASGCTVNETLTFAVLSADGQPSTSVPNDGGLFAIGGSPSAAASSLTVKCKSTSAGPFAFAIYLTPVDFNYPGSGNDANASRPVSFSLTGNGSPYTLGFTILRPPVLFVHGLWGAPSSWDDFCNLPENGSCPVPLGSPFTTYLADYSSTNGGSFAQNAQTVFTQLQQFVSDFKTANNAASVQMDTVGHSMGGNVLRTIVGTLSTYRRAANFDLGDIHKFISLDTPHLGSPLATNLKNSGFLCTLLFDSFGYPVAGAITDLSPGSAALKLLSKKVFPITASLITGVADSGQSTAALNNYNGLLAVACPNLVPSGGFTQLFGGPNDLIVGLTSQQGVGLGYTGNTLPVTAESNLVHTMAADLITVGPSVLNQNIVNGNTVWASTPDPQAVIDQLNTWILTSASFGAMLP